MCRIPLLCDLLLLTLVGSAHGVESHALRRRSELSAGRLTTDVVKPSGNKSQAPEPLEQLSQQLPIAPLGRTRRKYRLWVPADEIDLEEDAAQIPFTTSRVRRWHHHHDLHRPFWVSGDTVAWVAFFCALLGFVALHMYLIDWPSTRWYHGMALLLWIAAAMLYNLLMWAWFGAGAATNWLTGYLLEFVFSLENVFIYHIVISAFRTPRKVAQKALFIVVCCQIVFQLLFFMGLASWLQSIRALPYLLGLWLLYVGAKTVFGAEDESFKIEESSVFQLLKRCLGDRLLLTYEEDHIFVKIGGKTCTTMLGPVLLSLLLVDLLMEVDVTLTKIEEISSHYMAFTSSVAAAFAVPELFFVARDLFRRYHKLKYGIGIAILYFALELLLHDIVHVSDLVGMAFIFAMFLVCIGASKLFPPESDSGGVGHSSKRSSTEKSAEDSRVAKLGNSSSSSRSQDGSSDLEKPARPSEAAASGVPAGAGG